MKHHPLYRTLQIIILLTRYGLAKPLIGLCLGHPLSESKLAHKGPEIRHALEALGPLFIKMGQLLSTRFDVFPESILKALAELQDNVPPFSGMVAVKMVEKALGGPLPTFFDSFEETALASASIAQVHAATLISGEAVVVKILRPHIAKNIQRDLRLLKFFASFLERFYKKSCRFKPSEMVDECQKILYEEIDLIREGSNASQLKRNFKDSHLLYIPKVYWRYSTKNVLVMERVYGIPMLAFDRLKEHGLDRRILAKHLVELFFTQVFKDCFFHADLHPGNVRIAEDQPPRYIMMDFGMMGSLSPEDQHYLAYNFLAFLARDYRRVAILHLNSGWVPPTTRIDALAGSLRAICEPLLERPRKDVSLAALLQQLFQLAIDYQIAIQPQLILFQKTLASVEMLSLQLDPEMDLWKTAEPFLKQWLKDQMGFKALIRSLKEQYPAWIRLLPQLPALLGRLVDG